MARKYYGEMPNGYFNTDDRYVNKIRWELNDIRCGIADPSITDIEESMANAMLVRDALFDNLTNGKLPYLHKDNEGNINLNPVIAAWNDLNTTVLSYWRLLLDMETFQMKKPHL